MSLRVTWALLSAVALTGFAGAARGEEKPQTPCPDVAAATPAADVASEELEFEREMDRYAKNRAFTERLVAERERAFVEEQARYERLRALTKRLADEAERAMERDFERAVELYLVKVELTKSLARRDASAPSW